MRHDAETYVILFTGVIPGIAITVKLFIDAVDAHARKEQDPAGFRKAVTCFLLAGLICFLYAIAVKWMC